MSIKAYSNISNVRQALEMLIADLKAKGETLLPSERMLSEQLSCNRKTLRSALQQLDQDGITHKLARDRVLVATGTNQTNKKNLLLIAPTNEAMHDPTLSLFHHAFAHDDNVILRVLDSYSDPADVIHKVNRMIEEGVNTAFVVGNSARLAALQQFVGRMIFYRLKADDLMRDSDMPGVFIDYYHGAYIGIKHLIEIGRRKILVLVVAPEHPTHVFSDFERGCLDAAKDANDNVQIDFFRESRYDLFDDGIDAQNVTTKMKNVDAVFACEDHRLVKLHNLLIAQGVKIPGDIALLGFKDTPWATTLHPQLSSISTQDSLMVCRAIEMMEQQRRSVELIKPKLIIRESTIISTQKIKQTSNQEIALCT